MSPSAPDSPSPRKRRWPRRLAWAGGGLVALLLLVVATLDWWAPRAAEAWLGGTSYAERRTQAGRQVEWTDFVWEKDGLRFEAKRLRLSSPLRLLRDRKLSAEVEGWLLTIPEEGAGKPEAGAPGTKAPSGWPEMIATLREAGRVLEERVGEVQLRDGLVRAAGEELAVDRLQVRDGVVNATLRAREQTAELELRPADAALQARWVEGGVALRAELEATRGEARLEWAGNQAVATATFEAGQWLPKDFQVDGEDWRVPAETVRLGDAYEELRGRFAVRGQGASAKLELEARARPREADWPEVQLELAGEGGPERARLERLLVSAPQARARLSAPIEWSRAAGWSGEGEPEFSWEADLAALSGGELRGSSSGTARWLPGAEGGRVRWRAKGEGLAWREIEGASLSARGESDPVATRVEEADLVLADGSRATLRGRVVHETRTVDGASLVADIRGGFLRPWLPEGTRVGRLEADLRGGGRWPEPRAEGRVKIADVEAAGWAADALDLEGALREGRAWALDFGLRRGGAELKGAGKGDLEKGTLTDLSLRRGDGRALVAKGPVVASWARNDQRAELHLAGDAGEELRVVWDPAGNSLLRIRALDTSWLADWRSGAPLPKLALHEVDAEGGFGAAGLLEGRGAFDLSGETRRGVAVWARGAGGLGEDGARLERFEAGQGAAVLAEGAGRAPWRVRGGGQVKPEPVPGGEWDLRLESRAGADWWEDLAKAADLTLEAPTVVLEVSGPAEAPRGRAELAAARAVLRSEDLPEGGVELSGLRAEAVVEENEILLRRLSAEVDGQALAAEGRLALAEGDWARLRARPYAWLRDHAEARVSLPGAEVSALARYLPALLAPQGVLAAELRLSPGAKLDGSVTLRGAASRPIGNFGVLQDVEVALVLSGMEVRIETLRALAGGQPLVVTGGARRVPGRQPALDLAVKAERFPLVRKPGLLMRGDLDLTVKTAEDGRTRVGGEVRLRDSLFLADVRPLIARRGGGGPEVPKARPPYFSVDTPTLADWELALRVGGENFLRLRTPVFEGLGSARFDLSGTLREPRAVGEFRVERGNILFPFASFAVQEGTVRLSEADPYTVALDFRATGRRLGYDLRLELEGTAEEPRLRLYSSPPLDAERVLLMVTAGAAPTEGVGGSSGTQRLAAVGAYVGRDLLRSLGFGGTDEERLTISSGEKVSRQGRETYEVDFKLNDRWSLAGEYDEFDAYNVGVRRRFGPGVEEEVRPEERKESGP